MVYYRYPFGKYQYLRLTKGISCLPDIFQEKMSDLMQHLNFARTYLDDLLVILCIGVSDKTYGSNLDKILYGIGQGRCASPILWALINQLLLAALGEKFTCIRLVAIDGVEEHIRPGDSFVDDKTAGSTNDNPELELVPTERAEMTTSKETLVTKMEEILQFFLDLLQVTGGDLAPEKCVWYLIRHRWKDGKPKLLQNHSSQRGIKII
jgi:hypothetical protein